MRVLFFFALFFSFTCFLLTAGLAQAETYYSPHDDYLPEHHITVEPGTHSFEVDGFWGSEHWTEWYVDGVYQGEAQNDHTWWGNNYSDPNFSYSFSSGTTLIRAEVYDEDGNWENAHRWYVTVGKPDLIVQDISISPSSPVAGESVTITATLKNQGNADASRFYLKYYIDGSYIGDDDCYYGLNAGDSDNESISYTVSSAGDHTIKVFVDSNYEISESNENNNDRQETYYWNPPPKPDLRGSGSYQDKDYYPGDTVVFDFVVLNDGQASANSGSVYYYAHKDSESYSSSDQIGEDSYGDLDPGDPSNQTFWWHIPTDAPTGIYYVSFWVDATNTTPNESDEENNKGTFFVEVKERPGPDRRLNIIYPGIADRSNITWFIHISDVHLGKNDSAVPNLEWIRDTAYDAIDPDFVVATGDLTESEWGWCLNQSEAQWEQYYNIVNVPGFKEKYYDLPGNHDRYGDPEWDGETGNDGYANNSIRGPSSNPIGQFMWSEKGNYYISVNTCDETGKEISWYQLIEPWISDLPVLSDVELDDLEAKLIQAYSDPNGNSVFVFGHHSIFTRPDHPKNPGLYDERESIDEEDLNARGAKDFVDLLNDYQVSVYGFGHTHVHDIFIEEEIEDVPEVSTVKMNTGALHEDSDPETDDSTYRIVAIDNGGVSTTTATVDNWPVVLVTAPVDIDLGGDNPYSYPVPKHEDSNNKVRALIFNPDDLTEGDPTNDSDGDVQFCTTQAFGVWKDMKNMDGHIWEADLDVSSFLIGEYQVWVRANNGTNIRQNWVSFKVADPIATFELDPVQPGDDCTITVTGFGEGTYFRLAWDGQSLFATEQIVNGSSLVTFQIPPNPEANADAGSHYVRAFDEEGNYIVYYITVVGDTTPPDPSPMTWATEPYTASSTSISMVATTATDSESPPVSYFFDFVDSPTEGTGGSDSSWQGDTSYTNSGLQPNHQYGYQVKARDSAPTPNETNPSTPVVYEYTLSNAPGTASFSDVTEVSIRANWTANGNPSGTEYFCENTSNGTDSGWITNRYWDCTGLTCGTSYSFRVKARNGDGIETGSTELGSQSTQGCSGDTTPPDTSITDGPSGTITYDDITFTYTGSDNVTSTSNLVYSYKLDGYDSDWSSYTSSTSKSYNDLPNGSYAFNVRARDQAGNVDPSPDVWHFTTTVAGRATKQILSVSSGEHAVHPSCSPDGTKISYGMYSSTEGFEIWVMNSDGSGSPKKIVSDAFPEDWMDDYLLFLSSSWSPDGEKIAYTKGEGTSSSKTLDIWTINSDGSGIPLQITTTGNAIMPSWSPDGKKIAYVGLDEAQDICNIWLANSDGTGTPEQITNSGDVCVWPSWSPDGKKIAYTSFIRETGETDLWVGNSDGTGNPSKIVSNVLLPSSIDDYAFLTVTSWSPDGAKICYFSDGGIEGNYGIWVTNSDGSGTPQPITSNANGRSWSPSWCSNGTKIVYSIYHNPGPGEYFSDLHMTDYLYRDDAFPAANIVSPILNQQITGIYDVIGTVTDNISVDGSTILSPLSSWTLEYGEGEEPETWMNIVTSSTSKSKELLALWDTSALASGKYTLRLKATDGINENAQTVTVQIGIGSHPAKAMPWLQLLLLDD